MGDTASVGSPNSATSPQIQPRIHPNFQMNNEDQIQIDIHNENENLFEMNEDMDDDIIWTKNSWGGDCAMHRGYE